MMSTHKFNTPWKVVRNWRKRIAIVDSTNNGTDITSGRVCGIPRGKDGRGEFIAATICLIMNARFPNG